MLVRKKLHSRPHPVRLGIIGGGQLARMLALESHDLGLEVHILCENKSEPAAQVCANIHIGLTNNSESLVKFSKEVDFITFENEFYDVTSLKNAQCEIFPSPDALTLLQNRSTQKNILTLNGIPTAPFIDIRTRKDLETAFEKFKGQFVLKKCIGGYDGNGTFYCRSSDDLQKLSNQISGHYIAEAFVPFRRELALSIVRNKDGKIVFLPLVQSEQVQSRCDWVIGPIQHKKIKSLQKKLTKILNALDYVGVIAFELFDTGTNLLVNEIAPRVHNSAHYSQQGLTESQFLLHLKAGLGLDIVEPKLIDKNFCMVNLIGSSNQTPTLGDTCGKLHWYGKLNNRAGRKMGHINFTGRSAKQLVQLALNERKKFQL